MWVGHFGSVRFVVKIMIICMAGCDSECIWEEIYSSFKVIVSVKIKSLYLPISTH